MAEISSLRGKLKWLKLVSYCSDTRVDKHTTGTYIATIKMVDRRQFRMSQRKTFIYDEQNEIEQTSQPSLFQMYNENFRR